MNSPLRWAQLLGRTMLNTRRIRWFVENCRGAIHLLRQTRRYNRLKGICNLLFLSMN